MSVRKMVSASIMLLASCPALARAEPLETAAVETLVVTAKRQGVDLDAVSPSASRLNLTARETPATVETLTQSDLQIRGARTNKEAFNEVVGAISGNVPGNPAVVTLRGFSGGAVSILQDGVRISTATVVVRDTGTWHYDRIEVIKGPASVLYGEGALAGVINKISRKPAFDGDHVEALASYGSFNTWSAAGGANLQISDKVAARIDVSYLDSDGLYDVDDNQTRATGVTASLLVKPSAKLSLLFGVEHYDDEYKSPYLGVPLIDRSVARDPTGLLRSASDGLVVDRSLRRRNYNPEGASSGARSTAFRSRIDYAFDGGWALSNDIMVYSAKRHFNLSGDQVFRAPTAGFPNGRLDRTILKFGHDHDFWNERLVISNDQTIGGRRNRFSLGAEYSETDFISPRQVSPFGAVAAVDPFNSQVGVFPGGDALYTASNVVFDSRLETKAIFAEDAFNLTPRWLVLGAVRYDGIDLVRQVVNLNANGAVTRANPHYDPITWRVGTTYDLAPNLTVYGQYTTAVTPVSSVLLQSIAQTAFGLTKGRAYEAGFKATLLAKRVDVTGAVYHIAQSNILTRDPANPTQSIQGGEQSSRGAEINLSATVTPRLHLTAGASYTDAQYDVLSELVGGVRFDRSGKRPINTPSTTLAGSVIYDFQALPLTLGGFVRHVSGFYTDTANTYFVRDHTSVDASITYRLRDKTSVTLRGRNLTDAFYGEYSGYAATNIYIGAPRSVELSLSTQF